MCSLLKNRLQTIIKEKQSNICLSADVNTKSELFYLIELLGERICMLKIHYDIISDFYVDLENTIERLNFYKTKYNFVIWEDRKFADIGYIMAQQVNSHINRWADVISVHPIAGLESVKQLSFIPIILIGELSSQGNLTNDEYSKQVEFMEDKLKNLVGFVCQHKMGKSALNIMPGIALTNGGDNMGQKYSSLEEKKTEFADIYVIGRAITKSKDPLATLNNILNKIK